MITAKALLETMPRRTPRQDGTKIQMQDVEAFLVTNQVSEMTPYEKVAIANKLGCYDAADIYKLEVPRPA